MNICRKSCEGQVKYPFPHQIARSPKTKCDKLESPLTPAQTHPLAHTQTKQSTATNPHLQPEPNKIKSAFNLISNNTSRAFQNSRHHLFLQSLFFPSTTAYALIARPSCPLQLFVEQRHHCSPSSDAFLSPPSSTTRRKGAIPGSGSSTNPLPSSLHPHLISPRPPLSIQFLLRSPFGETTFSPR